MDENQKYFSHMNDTVENNHSQTLETIEKLARASFKATQAGSTDYYDFAVALAALLIELGLTNQLLHENLKTQIVFFAKVDEQNLQVLQRLQGSNDDEIRY